MTVCPADKAAARNLVEAAHGALGTTLGAGLTGMLVNMTMLARRGVNVFLSRLVIVRGRVYVGAMTAAHGGSSGVRMRDMRVKWRDNRRAVVVNMVRTLLGNKGAIIAGSMTNVVLIGTTRVGARLLA